jgi:hypothetical protein
MQHCLLSRLLTHFYQLDEAAVAAVVGLPALPYVVPPSFDAAFL